MEKKIQDYLHLYLGCEVYDKETKWGPFKLAEVYLNGMAHYKSGNIGISTLWDSVLLALRPLSSMTEEEKDEYEKIRFNDNFKLLPWHCDTFFESTRYLLSRGFDLFGLIDAGLALDKTLPSPQ